MPVFRIQARGKLHGIIASSEWPLSLTARVRTEEPPYLCFRPKPEQFLDILVEYTTEKARQMTLHIEKGAEEALEDLLQQVEQAETIQRCVVTTDCDICPQMEEGEEDETMEADDEDENENMEEDENEDENENMEEDENEDADDEDEDETLEEKDDEDEDDDNDAEEEDDSLILSSESEDKLASDYKLAPDFKLAPENKSFLLVHHARKPSVRFC